MLSRLRTLRWPLAALAAAACGCSSHAADPDAGARDAALTDTPVGSDARAPDTTPPSVVAIVPAPSGDTWLHERTRIAFDEAIDPASLADVQVTATLAGAPVAATLALDDPQTVAVALDPAARGTGPLALEIAGPLRDLAGNAITAPIDASYTIAPWSTRDLGGGAPAASPAIAVAASGAVYTATLTGAAGARQVVASVIDDGAVDALGDPITAGDAGAVALALDAAGRPVVAFAAGGAAQVLRWDGTSWQPLASPGAATAVALASPPGGDPDIALVGAQTTVLALDGDAWQPLGAPIAISGGVVGTPALAAPAAGRAVVGWIDTSGTLRAFRLDAAWTALAPHALGAPPSGIDHLSLAAHGNAIAVAWDQWGGSFDVFAAELTGGATAWTRLGGPLDVDVAGDAVAPAIAFDAGGAPIVAWTELIETAQRGVAARWSGGKWAPLGGRTFLTSASAAPTRPALALFDDQQPVIAWAAGGAAHVARFDGPTDAGFGLAARAPLTGCALSATSPPALLSQTGCFDLSTPDQPVAHPGLVPYDVVVELWSDGAKKRRWIGLPAGGTMSVSSNGSWSPPAGTMIVKEFALETTPGDPTTRRPVETRFLVRDAMLGWQGFSYRWNLAGTDASLQPDQEATFAWPMDDGSRHTHFYPSRSECLSCHGASYGPLLGIRSPQLARWFDYGGVIADQLATLGHLGVGPAAAATPYVSPDDPTQTWEHRMRGYMAANCAHCHNPDNVAIHDLRYTTPLADTNLCPDIDPGSPANSRVYQLVSSRPGMPPLATLATDPLAVKILGNWITGMTSCP